MKEILLSQNQSTIVDDEDYIELSKYKWCAHYRKNTDTYYAERHLSLKNKKQPLIGMHRVIMNAPNNMQVDHINHNTLDNRKKNLRLCTHSQNQMNKKPYKRKMSSKYKGVSWHKKSKKWQALISFNNKQIHIGLFTTEVQAAIAYNKKAKKLFGEFAYVF